MSKRVTIMIEDDIDKKTQTTSSQDDSTNE